MELTMLESIFESRIVPISISFSLPVGTFMILVVLP